MDFADTAELRRRMGLGLDIVMAHRIAKGLSIDRARMTQLRQVMEDRVLAALEAIDRDAMPATWSWAKAAETIAVEVALEIVKEQKLEPPIQNP